MLLEGSLERIGKQLILGAQRRLLLHLLALAEMTDLLTTLQQVIDTGHQQLGTERFGHIGIRPVLIPLHLLCLRTTGREQYHGDMTGDGVFLDLPA